MSEIRCVGSIFITPKQASLASSTLPDIAWQAIAIQACDTKAVVFQPRSFAPGLAVTD
jgi:hypothetical protein